MKKYLVRAAAALALGFATAPALADSESNGDPFPSRGLGQVTDGQAFYADNRQEPYPAVTGNSAQPGSLAALEPSFGSEMVVHTANALPRGFFEGTVVYAQALGVRRHFAAPQPGRILVASVTKPAGRAP